MGGRWKREGRGKIKIKIKFNGTKKTHEEQTPNTFLLE